LLALEGADAARVARNLSADEDRPNRELEALVSGSCISRRRVLLLFLGGMMDTLSIEVADAAAFTALEKALGPEVAPG